MDATHWILAIFLGLALAASTGLNASLPLFMLAVAGHFHLAGVQLNAGLSWVGSDAAMIVLGLATLLEIVGDKIPAVDHALHTVGTVIRPLAGWLAAASVLGHVDPTTAAVVGLIVGAPTALGFHAAKATTRVATTATTLGMGNAFVSAVEDVLSFAMSMIGFLVPVLVPIVLVLVIAGLWRLAKAARRRLAALTGGGGPAAPTAAA